MEIESGGGGEGTVAHIAADHPGARQRSLGEIGDNPLLHLPPDMRWSCGQCANCCRTFDEIFVSGGEIERILALPLAEIAPGAEGNEFLSPSPGHPGRTILSKSEGRCVFLSPENLCLIHRCSGAAAKPAACRQFPFLLTKAPDGVYVGLSFVCPSVTRNDGEPIENYCKWIQEGIDADFAATTVPQPVMLSEDLSLEWDEYRRVEGALMKLLGARGIPFEDRLIAGSAWLGMLDLFIRQTAALQNIARREAIEQYIDLTERDGWAAALRIARRPVQSPLLQRMFLGLFIAFRNSLGAPRGRLRTAGAILWNYLRHALRAGPIQMPPLEKPIAYADLKRIAFQPGPDMEESMERYFLHAIFRKDLVRRGDMTSGYCLLLTNYALMRWFAIGHAASRGAAAVEMEDALQAISMTERQYGAHSAFVELFQRYPVLNGIFYNVVRRKNFAHTLVRPG